MTAPARNVSAQHDSASAIRRGSLLMAAGVLAVAGSLVYSAYRVKATEETIRLNESRIAQQESILARNQARIAHLTPSALEGFGWAPESVSMALAVEQPRVEQSLQANDVLHQLNLSVTRPERSLIRVRYFAKDTTVDLNQRIVVANLRNLGYRIIVEKPPVPDVPTNAIWFGTQVDTADVKTIAYALLRAGTEIKAIRPFRQAGGAKAREIQIGADRALVSRAPLTVDDVKAMTRFERDTP